jgi:glycerol-3-phosphate dehydrogenase
MDDYQLGLWVAEQAQATGVSIREYCEVIRIDEQGNLEFITKTKAGRGERQFDRIINVTGPWSESVLQDSGIISKYKLDLVRGSHILFKDPLKQGYFLEVPNERRIFFVLPYQGKTLVGTTEIRQNLDDPIQITEKEKRYLLNVYNHYFQKKKGFNDIFSSFAGLRPLIKSTANPDKITREYAMENQGKVLTIFGGKWTTARALANKIVKEVTATSSR